MQAVRHLLAQRHVALWLCAATLVLRLLVPTGHMIGNDHGRVAIIACPGVATPAPTPLPAPLPALTPSMGHHAADQRPHHEQGPAGHGESDAPCAFAGLSAAMLGAVDPVLLAGLVAFLLRLGFVAPRAAIPGTLRHARPPLRGPPALA